MAAQRTAIRAECKHRGWKLLAIHEDAGASAKSVSKRPGLAAALEEVESGRAAGKPDRLLARALPRCVHPYQSRE
ncbi:MAG: recombinase family protein [Acidimicrobiales bacterium]